jgi:hypothetical protein
MAWNQGDDLYGYDNNRFLSGAEYVAKSNLRDANGAFNSLPFLTYANKQGVFPGLSPASQGSRRPVWESALHHYEGRLGVAAKYVKQQALQMRPENDGGNGDQLGFGTLTFARDPMTGGRPSGLTARRQASQVELSWWGTPDAVSYNVKRATRAGGPYTVVAAGVNDVLTWTDPSPSGSVWYVVTAVSASGESAVSNEVAVSMVPQLSLHLKFDEGTGLSVADATGRWPASTITREAGWTAGRQQGGAWALDGTSDFVTLPVGATTDLSDFTMAAWVYLDASTTWARVFEIGSGPRRGMFLAGRNAAGVVQFSIDTVHGYMAEMITGTAALPVGTWTHVAVTLAGKLGTLYVNGVAAGTNADMHLAPYRLGVGMDAWIGRSRYSNDPHLKGKVDDFRIYQGALDAAAMAALAAA